MEQFSELEVLQLAQNLEDRGFQFYSQAAAFFAGQARQQGHAQAPAGAAGSRDSAALARQLAEAEREHREVFQRLAREMEAEEGASTQGEALYLYDPEVSAYFRLLVATAVFPPVEEIPAALAALKTPADLLRLAIQAEKDALLFFQEFRGQARRGKTREVLEQIFIEEKAHLRALQEALDGVRVFDEALARFRTGS